VSEVSSDPLFPARTFTTEWYWLAASSTRLYAMWLDVTLGNVYHTLVTHTIDGGGRLGPAGYERYDDHHVEAVALDADADVFYTGRWGEGLTASSVAPDGRVTPVAESRRCAASGFVISDPLVGVRGFALAYGRLSSKESTVCSWQGPGLVPRSNVGVPSRYAVAFAPSRGAGGSLTSTASTRTLVAMRVEPDYVIARSTNQYEIRLFAMSDAGDLQPLDSVTGAGYARRMLFHPSGRFLYVSLLAFAGAEWPPGAPETLNVYSIDPQGQLELVQVVERGGGAMAVTVP
jgi:hypothetical protein